MVRHKNRIDRQQTPESIHSFKVCTVSCIDKVTDRHCCYTLTSTSNLLITAIAIASNTVEYSSVPYRISQPAIHPSNQPIIDPSILHHGQAQEHLQEQKQKVQAQVQVQEPAQE